jgi:hypothetical protein
VEKEHDASHSVRDSAGASDSASASDSDSASVSARASDSDSDSDSDSASNSASVSARASVQRPRFSFCALGGAVDAAREVEAEEAHRVARTALAGSEAHDLRHRVSHDFGRASADAE